MYLTQLEPELAARIEATRKTGHKTLQRIAVAVGRREEEEEVIFDGVAEDAKGGCGARWWG